MLVSLRLRVTSIEYKSQCNIFTAIYFKCTKLYGLTTVSTADSEFRFHRRLFQIAFNHS